MYLPANKDLHRDNSIYEVNDLLSKLLQPNKHHRHVYFLLFVPN